jgi:sec-independent protein translocase protein TatC
MFSAEFFSHLFELRDRLLKAVAVVLLIFLFLCWWPGASQVYDWLAEPLIQALPQGTKMVATGVITPFMIPLKLTLLLAFVLSLPWVFYQLWCFMAPGLYRHEKRLVIPVVFSAYVLFLLGVAFCYFFVFGKLFHFIQQFSPKSVIPAPDIEQYLSFAMSMFLAFGLAFEIPVVLVVLVRLGMCSVAQLRSFRRYYIVVAFVVSAIVTPPDVLSQLMLAIPMCILYEIGILVAKSMSPSKTTQEKGL